MNFSQSSVRSSATRAFTLIELLVVITIIAVLAGLLLPVGNKVIENARKTTTKSTETQIIAAVNSYQTEYGQYPVDPTKITAGQDWAVGISSSSHNNDLFNALRALNTDFSTSGVNTRRIVYFESKNVKNSKSPRDGFVATTDNPSGNPNASPVVNLQLGDLVDPWGNMYQVRMDTSYSNAVVNPYSEGTVNATNTDDPTATSPTDLQKQVRTGVISWTWGSDGIKASKNVTPNPPYSPTPGDDVDSWQ